MKVSFFRAVAGTCSGVKIFEDLRHQHGLRVFLHLLLMNFLCALFIGLALYWQWRPQINGSIAEIVDKCGSLHCGENGITPTKEPEKTRSFIIAGPMAVTYVPVESELLPEDFHQDYSTGIVFSGRHVAFWSKKSDKNFDLSLLNGTQVNNKSSVNQSDILKEMRQSQGVTINDDVTLTSQTMIAASKAAVAFGVISVALLNLFEISVYIAMFVGVFALMNVGRPKRFTIREMIKLAIYAGFPPMIIGSLAWALQLPLLDFNMVYVLGMTFYLMFIMNRLDRIEQEKNSLNNEDKTL